MIIFIDASTSYITIQKIIEELCSESMRSYAIGLIGASLAIPADRELDMALLL